MKLCIKIMVCGIMLTHGTSANGMMAYLSTTRAGVSYHHFTSFVRGLIPQLGAVVRTRVENAALSLEGHVRSIFGYLATQGHAYPIAATIIGAVSIIGLCSYTYASLVARSVKKRAQVFTTGDTQLLIPAVEKPARYYWASDFLKAAGVLSLCTACGVVIHRWMGW